MNLLFFSPQSLPSIGGLQYVVHYWAEALGARGHKITIITDTPSSEDGASPSALRGKAGEGVLILRRASFFQQVRAMRAADKVIMFNVSLKGLPAVLLSGKPLYVSHHTALWYPEGPRPLRQRLKQWVANHLAKDNCACSAYIAALYKKCRVIHSPYRNDCFVPGNRERKPGSILFAGRLVSDKGADLLIEAFARLLQSETPGDTGTVGAGSSLAASANPQTGFSLPGASGGPSLTLIGDGPEREKLEQLAIKLGLFAGGATSLPSGTESVAPTHLEPRGGDSTQPGLQAPGVEDPRLQVPAIEIPGQPAPDTAANTLTHTNSPLQGEAEGSIPTPHNLSTNQQVNFSTIKLTGPLSQADLVRQMQTHQIMVVPSRMEPMGMVVAEGLACGCHMVVSRQGGMPEVGGPFCRYFESGSVDSLAEALRLQLSAPLPVEEELLQKHLAKFTIEYSAEELEKWLTG